MEFMLLIVAAAALGWWAVFAQRGSLVVACGAFVALGYVLGPPLGSVKLGPLPPLTVDRLLLVALTGMYLWHWRQGRIDGRGMSAVDWLLLATVVYFTIRCGLTPPPPADGSAVKPWWRLIAAFWAPALLYAVVRTAPIDERSWRRMMAVLALLGAMLALTALAEITRQWWAVFPRYIADPTLGTHFGRARGPALNSASLGIMLTGCFWAGWVLWPRVARPLQLVIALLLALIVVAVYFTYTRSTWIGLAASLALIPLLQMPRQWRAPLAVGLLVAGMLGAAACGERIANLGRKDSDGSAEHSVYQRASFVYVSLRMFRDAPVFGCGFGRFFDQKIPYLADRSQHLELESLRNLDHHNTFLSLLTETGIVGCGLFVVLLAAWTKAAWQLVRSGERPAWQRAQGLFALAVLIAYVSSALFHDLTLSATEHWLPFLAAGLSLGLLAQPRPCPAALQVGRPVPRFTPSVCGVAP